MYSQSPNIVDTTELRTLVRMLKPDINDEDIPHQQNLLPEALDQLHTIVNECKADIQVRHSIFPSPRSIPYTLYVDRRRLHINDHRCRSRQIWPLVCISIRALRKIYHSRGW